MFDTLLWWLVSQILGLLALPLAYRLFDRLPDRGYVFAKPIGLLGTSYALWLLTTLGFLRNRWGAMVGCMLILGTTGWWFYRRTAGTCSPSDGNRPVPLGQWIAENRQLILCNEILLALAFLSFAVFRAYNPDIIATEKPMELAFVNGILRSDVFPPHDPWLSGFAISYYYFGYLMMALLTRLSGLPSSIAFNLMQATIFAWTIVGAFSLGYNLVVGSGLQIKPRSSRVGIGYGVLGAVLTVVMGNLEGLLELLHVNGIGSDSFWQWMDIKGLAQAPSSSTWYPTDNWWWWRASRVIHDRTLLGQDQEVIDEFPSFSFLLGDMHPHVLALPFLLLGFAVALQLLRAQRPLRGAPLVATGLLIGGLGFLNTWDFPLAMGISATAYALGQLIHHRRPTGQWLGESVLTSLELALIGVVAYLPFYLGFQSQAGGILPVVYNRTRLHQYATMFGPFLVVIVAFLAVELRAVAGARGSRRELAILGGTIAIVGLCVFLGRWVPTVLTLLLATGLFVGWRWLRRPSEDISTTAIFALLLTMAGLALTMSVEFVYLRDTFGTRMNTVFKFYYQAWACFGVAGAYGVYAVLRQARGIWRGLFVAIGSLALVSGLIYPVMAFYTKAGGFRGQPTLDGVAYLARSQPDDYAAIQWLNSNVQGAPVVLEANGGSYTYAARIATHTGLPTVLGWGGHELQWRGTYEEPGRREPDIRTIYTTRDTEQALSLLEKYDVRYVYVGELERQTFGQAGLAKFERFMDPVFRQGTAAIYRRRP